MVSLMYSCPAFSRPALPVAPIDITVSLKRCRWR